MQKDLDVMKKVGLLNSKFDKEQKGKERAGQGHFSSLLNVSGKNPIISNCTQNILISDK